MYKIRLMIALLILIPNIIFADDSTIIKFTNGKIVQATSTWIDDNQLIYKADGKTHIVELSEVSEMKNNNDSQQNEIKTTKQNTEINEDSKNDTCESDLKCWAKKHLLDATFASEDLIEKASTYQFEWTVSVFGSKFSHFKWHDKDKLSITYVGDKIKMQNGFSAWSNIIYEVDYDTINKKVLDIRMKRGRL